MPAVGHEDYGVPFEPVHDPFQLTEVKEGYNDTLDEKYKQLAKNIFGETDEKRKELVAELREELIKRNFKVPDYEAYYIKMLRAGGFTVDGAISVMSNYVSNIMESPQYLARAKASEAAQLCSITLNTILPERNKHGRRVYIFRPGRWDPDEFSFADCFAIAYMMSELMALEPKTQIAGVDIITDAAGFGFKQFWNFTFEDARKMARFVQDSFPLWYRSMNIVNASQFYHLAYNLVRPLLRPEVRDNVVFHDSLESLHKHIDKEILPEYLGGNKGEFSNADVASALEQMGDVLEELQSVKVQKDA